MNVLVACEFSGVVRDAFIKKGHNAWSCDLLPAESPGPHLQCDVREVLSDHWDLMIAHPPCTYLANSGVQHLHKDKKRWERMESAVRFFNELINFYPVKKRCIENPIPHKYGVGKTYSQIIQPWQFGHAEQKATCLWLRGLPKLVETNNVKKHMLKLSEKDRQKVWYAAPGKNRNKVRSITFKGIAEAMAEQWG